MENKNSESQLRERKKAAIRSKVLEVAHKLFHQSGFDGTTIEQICNEALISKRTFFRYFKDKESLVFPNREEKLEAFIAFLDNHRDVDNPFDSLRQATRIFGSEYAKNKDRLRTQQTLIENSLELRAREREIDQDWEKAIAGALSARAGQAPGSDLWAQVLAGAIIGVVRSTMTFWFAQNCEIDLTLLGLDALECLEKGFPKSATPQSRELSSPG